MKFTLKTLFAGLAILALIDTIRKVFLNQVPRKKVYIPSDICIGMSAIAGGIGVPFHSVHKTRIPKRNPTKSVF